MALWQIQPDDTLSIPMICWGGAVVNKTIGDIKELINSEGFNCAVLMKQNGYYDSSQGYAIFTNFGNVSSDLYLADDGFLQTGDPDYAHTIGWTFPTTDKFYGSMLWVCDDSDPTKIYNRTGTTFNYLDTKVIDNKTYHWLNGNYQEQDDFPPIFITTYNGTIYYNGVLPVIPIAANGGGATHIAKVTGQLKDLSSNLSDILMVSGGGGGGLLIGEDTYYGKDAGGISGSGNNSADQSTGYAFGQGESNGDVLDVSWQIYPSDDVVVPVRIYGGSIGENRNTTIGEIKTLLGNKGFNQAILAHDGYGYTIFTNFGNVSSDLYLADKDYLQVVDYKTIGFNFPAVTRFEQTTHWEIYRDGGGIANQTGSVWNNVATTVVKDGITYYYLITNNPQSFTNHPPIYVTTYNGTIKYNNKTSPTHYENVSGGGGGYYGGYRGVLK